MKSILILILLLSVFVFPQKMRDQKEAPQSDYIYMETFCLPAGDSVSVYITYRIPYDRLLFEKSDEEYRAHFRFSFEIFDSLQFIGRNILEGNAVTTDFRITEKRDVYAQGFAKFYLKRGNFRLISLYTDLLSNREVRLHDNFIAAEDKNGFYEPVVVTPVICAGKEYYRVVNFNGGIPFDGNVYKILIPAESDISVSEIEYSLNGGVFQKGEPETILLRNTDLISCEDHLVFSGNGQENPVRVIILNTQKDFPQGNLLLKISSPKNNRIFSAEVPVKWINKPFTLSNRELSVNLLSNIDDTRSWGKLLDAEDEIFDSLFFEFWKKYDPTPSTEYNELMNEFYSRADYSILNFGTISGLRGFESDRGKVYIKFGKPLKVERVSSEKGKMMEIWFYPNEKKFSFIDEKGTGEFSLFKG